LEACKPAGFFMDTTVYTLHIDLIVTLLGPSKLLLWWLTKNRAYRFDIHYITLYHTHDLCRLSRPLASRLQPPTLSPEAAMTHSSSAAATTQTLFWHLLTKTAPWTRGLYGKNEETDSAQHILVTAFISNTDPSTDRRIGLHASFWAEWMNSIQVQVKPTLRGSIYTRLPATCQAPAPANVTCCLVPTTTVR
jgi:hypothetical protein